MQQDLYLMEDYERVDKKSTTALLWTMGIGAAVVLAFAMKDVKKIGEGANVLLGITVLALPIYFLFKIIYLSSFLALNRIELSDHYEKKYTATFLMEIDKQTPMIYDFRTRKTLFFDKVEGIEKLDGLKTGDTVIISFRKGLFGIPFKPEIK